uniref:Uncharacterized protein n=1 Tax=Triticum urartu TaxID=4572 RepID=A0A8R7Q8U1_TRIUA
MCCYDEVDLFLDCFLLLESHMLRKSTSSSLRFVQAGERRQEVMNAQETRGVLPVIIIFLLLQPCLCLEL